MKIILGSSSVGRRSIMDELSKELGFTFEVMSPDIDEKSIRHNNPTDLVMAIANAKADVLVSKIPKPSILICSDQVVLYDNKIREKPINEAEARDFLISYSNADPELIGAIVVVNTENGKRASGMQKSRIHFKPLSENIIDAHIKSGLALSGAGGFLIYDPALKGYVDYIEGGLDSASGLSKELVKKLVLEVGGWF